MAELREGQTGTAPDGTRVIVRNGQIVPLEAASTAPGARYLPSAPVSGDNRSEAAYWSKARSQTDPAVSQAQAGVSAARRAEGLIARQEAQGQGTGGVYGLPFGIGAAVSYLDPELRELDAIQAQAARQNRQPGEGAISDFDAQQFVSMTYGRDKPIETNRELIQAQRAADDQAVQKREFQEWFFSQYRTTVGANEAWRAYAENNPIFDPASQQDGSPRLNRNRVTWREFFTGDEGLMTQAERDARRSESLRSGVGADDPETGLPTYPGIQAAVAAGGFTDQDGPTPGGPQGGGPVDPNAPQPGDVRVSAQPLAETDTPESLRAQGYVYDPARDTWSRTRRENVANWTPGGAVQQREGLNPVARRVDAFLRGAADTASLGFADEIAAGADALIGRGNGETFGDRYRNNVATQRAVDEADRDDVGGTRLAGQLGGGLLTIPALLAKGAPLAMNALRGVVSGGAYGAGYGAGSGRGGITERAPNALMGGVVGGVTGGVAPVAIRAGQVALSPVVNAIQAGNRTAGRSIGRVMNALNPGSGDAMIDRATPNALRSGMTRFQARSPQDVNALRTEVQRLQAEGIEPTFADVMNDGGRGVMRALGTRQTPARQAAREFAENRAEGLQDRIATQARRTVSDDPRSPDAIRAEIATRRRTDADQAFGAVRNEIVTPEPQVIEALRAPATRTAIEDAATEAANFGDIETANMLRQLTTDALDSPSGVQMTVGMADRLARTLNGRAEAAKRAGNDAQGASLFALAERLRGTARRQTQGYDEALNAYASESRLIEAADLGEQFLKMEADEFAQAVSRLSPEERAIAQAAARRAIEREAGTQGRAPGTAQRLSGGREQQARNAALLENPEAMQTAMRAEMDLVRNARAINPGQGAQTSMNMQDAGNAAGLAMDVVRRPISTALGAVANRIRARGFNDQEAEAVVLAAIDPRRTNELIDLLSQQMPRSEARRLARVIRRQATVASMDDAKVEN